MKKVKKMELRQYLKILQQNLILILLLGLFGMALAFLITRSMSAGYQKSQTFFLEAQFESRENLADFYAQEKARNFTDTAVAILESPDFRRDLKADGQIQVRKIAPQVVRITTRATKSQSPNDLMTETVNSFNSKLIAISDDQKLELKALGTSPEPAKDIINKKVFALAGLLLGFTFAIVAISLKTYFRL